jgi:hypothetical protein
MTKSYRKVAIHFTKDKTLLRQATGKWHQQAMMVETSKSGRSG